MTKEQILALVSSKIEGQGNQVDTGSTLPAILKGIVGKISDTGASFLSLERLRPYLYRITFDALPQDNGQSEPIVGGCSSFVRDGKLFRNLDFYYDKSASFIVRTRDFEGMAFITGLNDGELNEAQINQLPYRVVDGRNNDGIMVSTHVLYNDWDFTGVGEKNVALTRLPYLVLTNVKSMATIEQDLAGILDNVATVPEMGEYLLQLMVTDGTTTYAILPPMTDGQPYVLQDITSNPKLTNFRWVDSESVTRADLQDRPTGVERFNLMPCDLSDLAFTKAYESANRLSEFIGINGTTKDSTDEELTAIYNTAHDLYVNRERNGVTWHTMHAVIYGKNMESLHIQENWNDEIVYNNKPVIETVLMLQSNNNTTVGGYQVPELTGEQVQQAYNAVVTGRGCIIVDHDETMHAYVNQADALNGELSIGILFYSYMLLTYTLSGESVTITHTEI